MVRERQPRRPPSPTKPFVVKPSGAATDATAGLQSSLSDWTAKVPSFRYPPGAPDWKTHLQPSSPSSKTVGDKLPVADQALPQASVSQQTNGVRKDEQSDLSATRYPVMRKPDERPIFDHTIFKTNALRNDGRDKDQKSNFSFQHNQSRSDRTTSQPATEPFLFKGNSDDRDKLAPKPLMDLTNTPDFGKASPLRNNLRNEKQRSATHGGIFNVPKPGEPRPEHHRPASHTYKPTPIFKLPPGTSMDYYPDVQTASASATSKLAPTDPRPATQWSPHDKTGFQAGQGFRHSTHAERMEISDAPRRTYVMGGGYQAATAFKQPTSSNPIDLTQSNSKVAEEGFNPDKALGINKFGSYDPNNYVDAAQASENIKNLLEGAFEEDEDDKPKTRLRKRQQKSQERSAADELADKVKGLNVAGKGPKKESAHEEQEEEEEDGSVEGLIVKLLPHQINGVAWMLDKEIGERKRNGVLPKGGILADDMGLGKTIQALALVMSNRLPSKDELAANPNRKIPEATSKGTLVVAPLALIKQWESEIKDKVSRDRKLKVLVHHGPSRTKRGDDLKRYDMVITTYQTLTSEHEESSDKDSGIKRGAFGVHWYRIILDEAHSIKNRTAKMTKAAYALKAVYRWCLTGTPMQNNLDELQSLIHFLQIKPYEDLRNWKDQIGGPMKNGRGGIAMKRLQYFLKAFMKRRTKDVLRQEGALTFGKGHLADGKTKQEGFKIVSRQVETIVADFSENERGFYDRLAARTERSLETMMGGARTDYIGALVLLLRLRQTCNHPDLIRGNLRKEKDTMATGGSQPKTRPGEDVDDVADTFGSLSVETKKCDICQVELDATRASSGEIRCEDCEDDLNAQAKSAKGKQNPNQRSRKPPVRNQNARRGMHTRRIVESDEEDENADWVVPKSERRSTHFGKAGGADDEDAEGGGIWLNGSDNAADDEDEGSPSSHYYSAQTSDPDNLESDSATDTTDTPSLGPCRKATTSSSLTPPSTKIRRLLTLLKEEVSDHKLIVFSEFTTMLDLLTPYLRRALPTAGLARYDGSMPNPLREASLQSLRHDPSVRILLCSLRCGSLGLNLTAADRVVILEPFWNPFVEEQAIDRVHRLNQTRDVRVYKLTVRDSVEERILALQERKRELARAAVEGGSGKGVAELSMKDIMALFGRGAEHDARHAAGPKDLELGRKVGVLEGAALSGAERAAKELQEREGRERERSTYKVPYGLSVQSEDQPQKGRGGYDPGAFARRW